MSELMSVLEPLKRRSRYHRNEALEALKEDDPDQAAEDFAAAREAINDAINRLKALGAPDPASSERANETEIVIAEQLADCWGILGGICRAQGDDYLSDARDAYDEGYKYESSPRFNILSSYNRVNRLVVRILKEPELLYDPPPLVTDIDVPEKTMVQLLSEADMEIERQLVAGRRDRVWALADLVTVRLLGSLPKGNVALNDLEESTGNDTFPSESMLKVIRELLKRPLPMQDDLVYVGERLRAKLPLILQGEALASQSASA
jgi:hypothetical protein